MTYEIAARAPRPRKYKIKCARGPKFVPRMRPRILKLSPRERRLIFVLASRLLTCHLRKKKSPPCHWSFLLIVFSRVLLLLLSHWPPRSVICEAKPPSSFSSLLYKSILQEDFPEFEIYVELCRGNVASF